MNFEKPMPSFERRIRELAEVSKKGVTLYIKGEIEGSNHLTGTPDEEVESGYLVFHLSTNKTLHIPHDSILAAKLPA